MDASTSNDLKSSISKMNETSISEKPLLDKGKEEKSQKVTRIKCMIVLVFGYCLAEIIVGYAYNFLSLVADSFHMLSDSFALFIALYGIYLSGKPEGKKWQGKNNTFGWGRSEVITTLINAVFLTALCITIFMNAVERLFSPEATKKPSFVCVVGTGGLIVNIIGLAMFWESGHGHSHGGHGHSHGGKKKKVKVEKQVPHALDLSRASMNYAMDIANDAQGHGHSHDNDDDMNMRAVFLHVLADFLGSIVVIAAAFTLFFLGAERAREDIKANGYELAAENSDIQKSSINQWKFIPIYSPDVAPTHYNGTKFLCSDIVPFESLENHTVYESQNWGGCLQINSTARTFKYYEPGWVCYIDPVCSLTLVCFLLILTLPLLKEPVMILLQSTPQNTDYDTLSDKILQIENVIDVHCFHVWEFTSKNFIASLHIVVEDMSKWMDTLAQVEAIFKQAGTFNLTVQPECQSRKSSVTFSISNEKSLASAAVLSKEENNNDLVCANQVSQACCTRKSMVKNKSMMSIASKEI